MTDAIAELQIAGLQKVKGHKDSSFQVLGA
jgi:hypothetical protein